MKKNEYDIHSTDVLIIGGGIAAATAAIKAAANQDLSVTLVDRGVLGRSGSSPTTSGAVAFPSSGPDTCASGDSMENFFQDIYEASEGMAHKALVSCVAANIKKGIDDLEALGIPFERDEKGHYFQRRGLGHSYPRSCNAKGGGWGLLFSLRKEVLHRRVTLFEDTVILKIVTHDGGVAGAIGVNRKSQGIIYFSARTVILAAGSGTGLYPYSSANFLTFGDSYYLALEAGVLMANMEFVEFNLIPAPFGIVLSSSGAAPFLSRGAHLLNGLGERFMAAYDPKRMEQSTRGAIVQAMVKEVNEGRGPIYMDTSVIPLHLRESMEGAMLMHKIKGTGLNPWNERCTWVPAVHCLLGGILIDEKTRTNIPGLFSAGESTTGVHGANRLSGVALAECIVFGFQAGYQAARYCVKTLDAPLLKKELEVFCGAFQKGALDGEKGLEEIRNLAWETIGIIRTQESLQRAKEYFQLLMKEEESKELFDLASFRRRSIALTGTLIAESALLREESRGHHYREDYQRGDAALSNQQVLISPLKGSFTLTNLFD